MHANEHHRLFHEFKSPSKSNSLVKDSVARETTILLNAQTCAAQKMATIFTRAKAAKKAIDLIELECGIPRSRLRCDSRLESDLGIVGDDTYALLEAMHKNGVEMSRFDCHDRITPEGQDAVPMLIYFGLLTAFVFVFFVLFPDFSSWLIVPV
ncbi:MAG: hypothetical protein ABL974_12200, partial [Prosthecobacter sp.]